MLCFIIHICKDAKDHSDSDHMKQVNNVIKKLSHELSEDEMEFTLELFWTEYTDFYNKNVSFDGDEFIF